MALFSWVIFFGFRHELFTVWEVKNSVNNRYFLLPYVSVPGLVVNDGFKGNVVSIDLILPVCWLSVRELEFLFLFTNSKVTESDADHAKELGNEIWDVSWSQKMFWTSS